MCVYYNGRTTWRCWSSKANPKIIKIISVHDPHLHSYTIKVAEKGRSRGSVFCVVFHYFRFLQLVLKPRIPFLEPVQSETGDEETAVHKFLRLSVGMVTKQTLTKRKNSPERY